MTVLAYIDENICKRESLTDHTISSFFNDLFYKNPWEPKKRKCALLFASSDQMRSLSASNSIDMRSLKLNLNR